MRDNPLREVVIEKNKHFPWADAKQTGEHTNLKSGKANERILNSKFLNLSGIGVN